MSNITEIRKTGRTYGFPGSDKKFTVDYTIYLEDGSIVDIRNANGFSVEPNSECWDYFTAKVNAWRNIKRIPV
jgi:hypothetical protein